MPYDCTQIAKELQDTATGVAYHGNALRVAKDISILTDKDRAVLERWLTGRDQMEDFWNLQEISLRVMTIDI